MVTKVKELTIAQLKTFIDETVEEKLRQLIGDPDEGLELRAEIIEKLKSQKIAKKKRVPMEQIAREFGLNLK